MKFVFTQFRKNKKKELRENDVGSILVGDFNCHNIRLLRFSAGMSTEGRALHRFTISHGLKQIVREATRGDYLLDIVLTDLGDITKTSVLPAISDHKLVLATFKFSLEKQSCPPRTVWYYQSADWDGLNEFLYDTDFSFVSCLDVDSATKSFTQTLLNAANVFVSRKT